MRLFLSLLLLLPASLAFSQAITITNADFPAGGDTFYVDKAVITNTGIVLSQTGTNYTWDFSKLLPSGTGTDTFFKMSQVPVTYNFIGFFGASFATHTAQGYTVSGISFTDIYNMYGLSSKAYTNWGYGATVTGLPLGLANTPKDTIYHFPLNYGNVDSCTSAASASIPTIGSYAQKQTRHNIVDGWGTVITPLGSYTCLRVKTTIVSQDSIYLSTLSTGLKLPATTTYQYKWLSHSFKEPVVEIDATDIAGNPTISSIKYRGNHPAAVQNITPLSNVSLYPVPAGNYVTVSGDKRMTVMVFDIMGRMVWQGNLLEQPVTINTQKWPAGAYIARLSYMGSSISKSFTVTH